MWQKEPGQGSLEHGAGWAEAPGVWSWLLAEAVVAKGCVTVGTSCPSLSLSFFLYTWNDSCGDG